MLVIFCSSLLISGCADSEQQRKEAEAKKLKEVNEQMWQSDPNKKTKTSNVDPLDDHKGVDNKVDKI